MTDAYMPPVSNAGDLDAMNEMRRQWHDGLIRAATAYVCSVFPPGMVMDHLAHDLNDTDRFTPGIREDLAREVLKLPLPGRERARLSEL